MQLERGTRHLYLRYPLVVSNLVIIKKNVSNSFPPIHMQNRENGSCRNYMRRYLFRLHKLTLQRNYYVS